MKYATLLSVLVLTAKANFLAKHKLFNKLLGS